MSARPSWSSCSQRTEPSHHLEGLQVDPRDGSPAGQQRQVAGCGDADVVVPGHRGIALHQAALIVPYYAETNRGFVALARRTIEEVIAGSPA